jgi:hypothetical protein
VIVRRFLLLSLVAYCASLLGCATPDAICDMRVRYEERPMTSTGNVRLAWRFDAETREGNYGVTDCYETDGERLCLVRLKGPPPKFSDVCGLAKLGHEVAHAMNATHD